MDGKYTIIACDACGFAKEPQGFTKLEGRPDTERYTNFAKIPAKSQGPTLGKIDMSVPKRVLTQSSWASFTGVIPVNFLSQLMA